MILGLPISTFIWVFIVPLIGVVFSIFYGVFFKDDEKWSTVEDLFKSSEKTEGKED